MKIRKAILPVAGMGTRFMPASKVVPKELLPIVDKPVVQYLVEEAILSGIEEIIFVISPDKELIRQHFSYNLELENTLKNRGKKEIAEKIHFIHNMAKFSYVYQNEALGDGHAILQAEKLIDEEAFAVLFGDDIVKSSIPACKQLIDQFKGESIIAVKEVDKKDLSSYGIVKIKEKNGKLYELSGMIEKPKIEDAPSKLGIIGKYICPSSIFDAIRQGNKSKNSELRLIDGFIELSKKEKIWAYHIEGERFDTGKPKGLIEANNAFFRDL